MAISIKKYVDITSGVGAGASVRQRDLIGRIFTANPRVPVDALVEVESADDARTYFGASSEEYLRAAFYFSFVSKNITAPKRLSFARFANEDAPPRVYGARTLTSLTAWQAVSAGTLNMQAGDAPIALTGLNFSGATSLANVASILQTAIRAATGAQYATATVAYDAVTQSFNFTGSSAVDAPMSVTVLGTPNDIASKLGWGVGAVMSPGVTERSITDTLGDIVDQSNNFGSFLFIPDLTENEIVEAATWNAARNVEFMYCVPVTDANMVSLSAALIATAGVALTYTPVGNEYDEMVPMIIMAATDYSRRNSVQNYMFQQFGALSAKVTTTLTSNEFDLLRVNYYGNTQTAGQIISFYQRGVLCGGSVDPVDMNTYANELWLKDAAQAALMSLLLAAPKVSANTEGRGQILAIVQDAIDRALNNGVISVGKRLSVTQKLYIAEISGDDLAYAQVQDIGYWVDCEMQSFTTPDGRVEFKAVYTLIYAKDDVIRKIEGSHVLI